MLLDEQCDILLGMREPNFQVWVPKLWHPVLPWVFNSELGSKKGYSEMGT